MDLGRFSSIFLVILLSPGALFLEYIFFSISIYFSGLVSGLFFNESIW